ncbi:MAG TPA: molybdenum ABC transporter ATP-binding protein [Burkholderiaceae bacterium]|nr:molybdenum ABC transporter ATP-binding protein [Burkholderiaceae bacterium]
MSESAAERLRIDAAKQLGAFEFACDLDLPLSGLTAIFGVSGAGKSTLINLVAGMHQPDRGRIAIGSTVFFDSSARVLLPVERRGLGYVFQDARLFPHLSVRGNLDYGRRRAGARSGGAPVAFDAVVDLLGLGALLERRPHTLSGGEKQRVAFGRALLAQPRLLLMDEPLASLDAARKAEILPYIERLRDEFAIPILYVSHSPDEVLRLATALVLVDAGRVVTAGPISDVLLDESARQFFSAAEPGALVFAVVASHDDRYQLSTLACDGFALRVPRVDLAPGTQVRLRIPAREVALALVRPGDVSITNRIEGSIESVGSRSAGHPAHALVTVRVSPSTVLVVTITRESVDRLGLVPGLRVWCLVKSVVLDASALVLARGRAARPVSQPLPANDARV